MKNTKILIPASGLWLVSTALAGDWPQFRGPGGSGLGDGMKPPVHWDVTKGTNISWAAEIPGLADSSPIVWGDRVYVTTAVSSDPKPTFRTGLYGDTDSVNDSSPHKWKVLALDKKNRQDFVGADGARRYTQDQEASKIFAGVPIAGH